MRVAPIRARRAKASAPMSLLDKTAPEATTPADVSPPARRVVAFETAKAARADGAEAAGANPRAKGGTPGRARLASRLEKASRKVAADALADPTRVPLEVMLDNMSWAIRRAHRMEQFAMASANGGVVSKADVEEAVAYRELAQAAATAAAPYMHPKMAPIVAKGQTGVAVTFTIEDA